MQQKLWKKDLKTVLDVYKGMHVIVSCNPLPQQFKEYVVQLEKTGNYRSIWIELTSQQLNLLDVCVNHLDYKIHSGLNKEIVVYKWLSQLTDLVVPYSIFWIAAGALVIHENKVLLVKQKSGKRKDRYGLPGGRADRGELIGQCAERQLLEETGVRAKFDRIVFIRELTKDQIYNCCDIYFVCLMKLQQNGLANLKICEREILGYEWVSLQDYAEFSEKHSIGTQVQASKHISKLYKEGRLYENQHYSKEINLIKNSCHHKL